MLELKAVAEAPARGVVVEVEKERGRGVVATVLVQSGTLRIGDPFVVGLADGKVRALYNERGKNVESAGPSQPVVISGLNGVPQAGDMLAVVSDDRLAKEISAKRSQQQWERADPIPAPHHARGSAQDRSSRERCKELQDRHQGRRGRLCRRAGRLAGETVDRRGQGGGHQEGRRRRHRDRRPPCGGVERDHRRVPHRCDRRR